MKVSTEILDILKKGLKYRDFRKTLAEKAEITPSTLSRFLNNKIKNLDDGKWCVLYDVCSDWINKQAFGMPMMSACSDLNITLDELAVKVGIGKDILDKYEQGFLLVTEEHYAKIVSFLDLKNIVPHSVLWNLKPDNYKEKAKDNNIPGLAEALKIHGISKKDFAAFAGFTERRLISYEEGSRNISSANAEFIAGLLGISTEALSYGLKGVKPARRSFSKNEIAPEVKFQNLPADIKEIIKLYCALNEQYKSAVKKQLRLYTQLQRKDHPSDNK